MSNKITIDYLKRKEIRNQFGHIIVKNPNPEQRKQIAQDIIEMNKVVSTEIQDFLQKYVEKGYKTFNEIPKEEIEKLEEMILKKQEEINSNELVRKYLKELTNIPHEILDDDKIFNEIIEDPSDDLRMAFNSIIEIISQYASEITDNIIKFSKLTIQNDNKISKEELEKERKRKELLKKKEELEKQIQELEGE